MSKKIHERKKTNIKGDKDYELKETISLTQLINNIIINHIEQYEEHLKINDEEICSLEKYFNLYNSKNFYKYYFKLQYISNIKYVFKNNNNKIKKKNYMTTFIYLIKYITKLKSSRVFDKKKELLKGIENILFKLYTMHFFNNTDILIILKFIIYSSIYQRKDIDDNKTELLNDLNNKKINNYNIFKYSIDIVKTINNFEITEQYYEFLLNKVLKNKANLFLISNKLDLLELLFLSDKNKNNEKKILKFLAQVYFFKYNKLFLDTFFQKINNKYNYYNPFNPIDLFNDINKSLFLLKELQNKEDDLYKKDSYILNHGFVCNNDRYNGINVENVILQSEFTIIFSFNFSPELDTFDTVNQKDLLISSIYKMKQQNILQKDSSIYPILYIIIGNNRLSNDGLNFYIQDGYLYHKVFNLKNEIKVCPVEQNMTYICCYTIKENHEFIIYIRSEKENKLVRENYNYWFKKNLTLKLGKFVRRNFEGYIGPVLLFKKYYDDEFLKAIINLKGFYDKMLFIHNFSNEFVNKYDRIQNYLKISDSKKRNSFLNAIKAIIEKKDINEDLEIIITPVYEGSRLDKKSYVDCTFKETKTLYYTKPKVENGATFFFRNNYTPFEFIRYEGINYIILIFELISNNINNLKKEYHKDIILDLFVNVIDFAKDIVSLLCPDYYYIEMKRLLFAFEKCIINICKIIKMCHKMNKALADLILFLSSKLPGLSKEKVNNNIQIRNELLKLLVDTNLYDLNDYSSLSYFLRSFNDIFIINSIGILNMDFFTKIINFAVVFEQITNPKNNEIKKNIEYKKFKKQFIECLNSFFEKYDMPAQFIYIFQIFSDDIKFNYYKYQFLKIFYLNSEIYFSNIEDKKSYILTWKYFIKLYESIQSKKNFIEISKKEAQIIMAICLRIIFENPIVGDFYKSNKKSKNAIKTSINKNIKYISNKISIWKLEEYEEKTIEIRDDKSKYFNQRKRSYSSNSKIKNQLYSNESKINNNYLRENSEDEALNCKVNKYGFNVNNKKKDIILNKMNINSKKSFEVNNQLFSNEKCLDYKYFVTLFPKLCSSTNFNDYCFRSLLLLILEKNNEVNISQKIKFKFIAKIKKYEDFEDKDYEPFLKIKYYGKETKYQFISLLDLIEKNVNQLSFITFDIMLYLIIKTSEEKKKNKCVFKHLISSKKICGKLFVLAFTYNKQALISIFGKISKLFDSIIPYHKNPFIFDFIYDIMTNEKLRDHGQVLINLMAVMSFENVIDSKFYYHFHVKILLLLYRIIKSKNIKNEKYIFEEQVISNLFKENLIETKYNMLYNIPWAKGKKKSYVELLFEVLVGLCIKTNSDKYILLLYKMFILYVTKFTNNEFDFIKLNNKKPHSILFFIDQVSSPCNKSNPIQKCFSKYDTIDVPSLTVKILLKTLKYYIIYKNTPVKDILISLSSAFHLDANEIFLGKDSKRKKEYKNKILYNQLRTIIINSCKKPKGKDKEKKTNFISHDSLLLQFEKIYNNYLSNKTNANNSIDFHRSISFLPIFKIKIDDNNLSDDSFSSCKSDKNIKNQCIINNKKKFKTTNKENLKNMLDDMDKNEDLLNIDDNATNINLMNYLLIQYKSDRSNTLSFSKKEKKDTNNIDNKNPFNFEKINNYNDVYLFPKQNLIEQIFAIYFINKLFYNEPFVKMRYYYKYIVKKKTGKIIDMKNYFNYPTIMKNYIPENIYFGGLFLKHDLNFFTNDYFNISHPYFIEKSKKIYINRIFKKKSQQNDINKFIVNKKDPNNNMFYVDLITNRKVIFGELIVGKYLIYFHSKDKKQFLKGKSDKEIISWILCSSEYDYSSKKKKIYIFKEEITEIINRRFLYSFQACEFYLKNGKSYFFNFYSEDKKIKFFSLFSKKNIIISDLKSDFKKKNFTKLWLNDNISTLEYLLFINKYSCRSYNDVNQYPVFPWLKIYGEKERDLRYTIVAQTEEERMVLKEIYSINNFHHHYTTHYSNASFLIYYLLRVNPFTDNQITLQVKKFDVPERQFTSFDELQRILFKTKQPREIIPEFFINTNFFYNYNCNFFGIKNDGQLVENLSFNKNYKSPLDYVLSNATMLESTKVKSTINYFFDNIFGVGQMGGCEKYNTYDKYCYQEMIDLNHKINSFQANGLSLREIKEKIARKTNKIISFGQTPFKLLEDQHPQWTNEKMIEKNSKNINSYINFKYQIIHYGFLFNSISNKSLCFILTKKSISNFELCFYDLALKEEIEKDKEKSSILIPKKIKLFSKLYIFDSRFLFAYKYNPKFIMINYELLIFIFSHLTDNSFTIFNQKGNYKSYLTSSLITCIIKGPRYYFLTGHIDGIIIEWKINFKKEEGTNYVNLEDIKIEKKREYIAHKKNVNGIYYSKLLDLIISSGDDKIYIRKYYDLSLLSVINIENKLCIELKINHCHLYILLYNEIVKSYIIKIYSLNGILVGESDYCLINNFDVDRDGNILIGYFKEHKIDIFNPSIKKKINEIKIDINPLIDSSDNFNKINTINNNSEEIPIFQSFYYQPINNSVYCSFSNGYLIKKYIGSEK